MRSPTSPVRRTQEAGSALLIAVMVSVILTLLGLSYLALADQENAIARNQRDSDQLLFVAEAGAHMVRAWFDRPVQGDPNNPIFKFMGDYDLRWKGWYDFTKRVFDHDNDPNTAPVLASSTDPNRPLFRQGMTVGSDPNYLTMWDKPYRGSRTAEFRGTESGPDVQMVSDPNVLDGLDIFNSRIVGDRIAQETVGRIQQIDVYAPPIIDVGGVRTRYGICTVKVTASKFRRMGNMGIVPILTPNSVEVARRVVKMVLNETPYPGPQGPFTTCTRFDINGNVKIHWGEVVARDDATVTGPVGNTGNLQDRTFESVPWSSATRYLDPNNLMDWLGEVNGTSWSGFDPWFKLRAGGALALTAPSPLIQPFPYSDGSVNDLDDDESNLFQFSPVQCPDFDYQIWKNVALTGGQNIHYMVHSGGPTDDLWREDGAGTARSMQDWTNSREAFFFFDTTDRQPPDPNGANTTPEVGISGNWASSGFIYLNSRFRTTGGGAAGGAIRVLIPPGEPWSDSDGDKVADPGEFVNLRYPTSLAGVFRPYVAGDPNNPAQVASVTSTNGVTYNYTTDPNNRDAQGLPFTDTINFQGVFYVQDTFEFQGNLSVFGALQTNRGMQTSSSGTPDVYFDERLIKGGWPPPELNLPRVTITFYQTEM
jgi:hypothetical protein